MSSDPSERGVPRSSVRHTSERRRLPGVVPALCFLLGLLLGAVLVAVRGDSPPARVAAPPAAPSASPAPARTEVRVTVPDPCVQAAEQADEAYALVERGVQAARDLDAGALADLVAEVQRDRPQVQSLAQQCRQAANAGAAPAEDLPSPAG